MSFSKCWVCKENANSLCSNCNTAVYCTKIHQKKDWEELGHDLICDVIDNESDDKDAFLVNVCEFMKSYQKNNTEMFQEIISNAISADIYRNKSSSGNSGSSGGGRGRESSGSGSHRSYPSEHTTLSPEKARNILRDGQVHGHPLTPAQRGFFGAIASRGKK